MYPKVPDIDLKEKNVFVEEQAGVVMAQKYMKCVLNHLRKSDKIDVFEETSVLSVSNYK